MIELGVEELLARYGDGSLSPVEVVDALAGRIERVEPALHAFVTTTLDAARTEAQESERRWAEGRARALEGVPVAVKDLYDTAGIRTTYGSRIFAEHVPARDAEVVRLLREAGAILLGKASTHEFAWGITGYNPFFDSGRNPWDLERVSGGSSGGSAAAVAAREVPLALGSDTGASIRVPASFCGVVGFKPSFGLVPTEGLFPLSPSLDHAGPIARTPADCALAMSVLAGRPFTPVHRPLRVGISGDLMRPEPTPSIAAAFRSSLDALGAEIVEVGLPEAAEALPAYMMINALEGLHAHRDRGVWPARRDEYSPDVSARFELAESLRAEDYVRATFARERIRAGFVRAFQEVELLATPLAAVSPLRLGETEADHLGERRLFRELVLPYTTPHNILGTPACALRAGFDDLGMPVGIQLAGPPGADELVLGAAQALLLATPEIQARQPAIGVAS